MLSEIRPVEIEVPRDTDSSFERQIVRKPQQRLSGTDEIVPSLTAKGLTTPSAMPPASTGINRP